MKITTPSTLPFFLSTPLYIPTEDHVVASDDWDSFCAAIGSNELYQVASAARIAAQMVCDGSYVVMAPRSIEPDMRRMTDDMATLVIGLPGNQFKAIRFLAGSTFEDIREALKILSSYSGVRIRTTSVNKAAKLTKSVNKAAA